jgi:hypothetical protein
MVNNSGSTLYEKYKKYSEEGDDEEMQIPMQGEETLILNAKKRKKGRSDGSTASYYELPEGAEQLQDLISHKNLNGQLAEIFRECYRFGEASHCDELRGIKKILFYAEAEKKRLENLHAN